MRKMTGLWGAALAVLLYAPGAGAAGETRGGGEKASPKSFIKEASSGGKAEIELGKLASQRASNEKVREFGEHMADDHKKANDDLQEIAEDKGVPMATGLEPKYQSVKSRLSGLSGAAFDRAFIQQMIEDHEETIAKYEKAASGGDPDVRKYANDTLPTLRDHLRQARELQKQLAGAQPGGGQGY